VQRQTYDREVQDIPAIETFGLSKTYPRKVQALESLDLRVEPGEVLRFTR
jgi:ABC-type multidrug transport system ATPase subunit